MISVKTQKSIIEDIQGINRRTDFLDFIKALSESIPTGDTITKENKGYFVEDFKDFLDIMTGVKKYEELDTAARDYLIGAYMRMHI